MWSVRTAFLLIFLAVVAVPLSLFWVLPHAVAMQTDTAEAEARHLVLARGLAGSLQRYHQQLTFAFDSITDSLLAGQAVPYPIELLRQLRFRHVQVIDAASGRVLGQLDILVRDAPPFSEPDLAVLRGLAARSGTQFTGVMRGDRGMPVLHMVKVVGTRLVVGTLDTRTFTELGRATSFGHRGHAVIVDGSGHVLAHPQAVAEHEMRDFATVPVVGQALAGRSGVASWQSSEMRQDLIAGFAAVAGTPWGAVVAQPVAELRERADAFQRSALAVFAMGLIAAALVALRASIVIVEPVQRLIAAKRRLQAGEANVRMQPPGRFAPRELAELTASFNAMATSIAEAHASEAEARRRAERSSEQKSEVMRYVTHELRSPVNAILGFAQLLTQGRHGPLGAPAYEAYARDIHGSSKHLLSLINDLLDLAKIEAGRYELREEPVGLDEIVERCVRYIAPMAQERGIKLDVRWQGEPPTVIADERALFQIVLNLATNAVRYGAEFGEVMVRCRVLSDGGVELAVVDDGPGIAPDDLPRVLEPFQRVDSARTRGIQGSGLGLPIVKRLVELHNGCFALESEVGIGTVGRVQLPAARVVQASPRLALVA